MRTLPPDAPFSARVPVSYTHLDVYKRQLLALSAAYQEPDKQVEAQAGARQLSVQVSNAQEDEMLLLPLTNEKGWSCVVNGRRVEITDALGCLMAIPLEAGRCV